MKLAPIAAAFALCLTGCAPMEGAGRAMPVKATYVSMGSSFAAGANIGPLQAGSPERCGRTTNNYASLLSARMDLTLIDVGCGGAKSEHILGAWNELPPQIDALTADTRLVTITIGGNDVNYVGWLFASSCKAGVPFNRGPSAQAGKCPSGSPPGDELFAKLDSNLRAITAEIRRRAPNATIVFVQYVSLVSDTACPLEAVAPEDAAVAKGIAKRLSAVTSAAARDSGALVINTDDLSKNHTPCSAEPWANGFSGGYDMSKGAPWHPNAAGHAAIADSLFALFSAR